MGLDALTRRLTPARHGLAAALLLAGCGDEAPRPEAFRATVTIVYLAATTTDPAVAAGFASCVAGIERTHMHPSWRGFERVDLRPAGDRWTATFTDVPVGSRERFRVNDPNACPENATGAVTRNILANGVPLTEVVGTPGAGTEPGVAFSVAADGSVTP